MEDGTARTAGRMKSRTSDPEMPESRFNIHLCARRSGLDCIAFPNFIFANSHRRHGTPFISKRAAPVELSASLDVEYG
jgi:hypothetical protein